MTQEHHTQEGLFLVTTNTKDRVPWLTLKGVPERLIRQLAFTRNLYGGRLYAFCVLPDHMHIILNPGERGLSRFMQSFKTNVMRDIRHFLSSDERALVAGNGLDSAKPTWQHSFHVRGLSGDRLIANALLYVQHNALRHRLADEPNVWPWTSLNYPYLLDPMEW